MLTPPSSHAGGIRYPSFTAQTARDSDTRIHGNVRVVESIQAIDAVAWNTCFPNELENYDYLLAVEEAGIQGFTWCYAVVEEHKQIVAAMPAFLTDYTLDTTLDDGKLRRLIRRIRTRFPRFLTMKLACLGSPETECGLIGFHPSVNEERKSALTAELLAGFEHYAHINGCKLIGIKDIPMDHKRLWAISAPAYTAIPGMATAQLMINFKTINEYMACLSSNSRKDMRRKLRSAEHIRIEERTNIDDVLPKVLALYKDTKERSEFQFEELTEAYFRGVLARMPGKALCTLYWQGEELLAANVMLKDERTLLDKFFCMDGVRGREHNLYFLSWFHNLQYCLDHGIKRYQSGQACYENKLRLKSGLNSNWMMFRHTNPVMGCLLRLIAPMLAMENEERHD
ncbi:MAG: GNAT family N-acetyltransferase [Proteobacteria bacterium]|nr:GNAT family N-acetyltransferase [Pseudomonadota bacterium]